MDDSRVLDDPAPKRRRLAKNQLEADRPDAYEPKSYPTYDPTSSCSYTGMVLNSHDFQSQIKLPRQDIDTSERMGMTISEPVSHYMPSNIGYGTALSAGAFHAQNGPSGHEAQHFPHMEMRNCQQASIIQTGLQSSGAGWPDDVSTFPGLHDYHVEATQHIQEWDEQNPNDPERVNYLLACHNTIPTYGAGIVPEQQSKAVMTDDEAVRTVEHITNTSLVEE